MLYLGEKNVVDRSRSTLFTKPAKPVLGFGPAVSREHSTRTVRDRVTIANTYLSRSALLSIRSSTLDSTIRIHCLLLRESLLDVTN